jgi:hypothetical protein
MKSEAPDLSSLMLPSSCSCVYDILKESEGVKTDVEVASLKWRWEDEEVSWRCVGGALRQ